MIYHIQVSLNWFSIFVVKFIKSRFHIKIADSFKILVIGPQIKNRDICQVVTWFVCTESEHPGDTADTRHAPLHTPGHGSNWSWSESAGGNFHQFTVLLRLWHKLWYNVVNLLWYPLFVGDQCSWVTLANNLHPMNVYIQAFV